jgi:hypothetical protein
LGLFERDRVSAVRCRPAGWAPAGFCAPSQRKARERDLAIRRAKGALEKTFAAARILRGGRKAHVYWRAFVNARQEVNQVFGPLAQHSSRRAGGFVSGEEGELLGLGQRGFEERERKLLGPAAMLLAPELPHVFAHPPAHVQGAMHAGVARWTERYQNPRSTGRAPVMNTQSGLTASSAAVAVPREHLLAQTEEAQERPPPAVIAGLA